MQKKKTQSNCFTRNNLKRSIILNDLSQILYSLQKTGHQTGQHISNLAIFVSFFVTFFSLLQISLHTRHTKEALLTNYPFITNSKVAPNKFETLYLQSLDGFHKDQQLVDLEDNDFQSKFCDSHQFPMIFQYIQNKKQMAATLDLYKTFEQMGPLLLSEMIKENSQENQQIQGIQQIPLKFNKKSKTDLFFQSLSSNSSERKMSPFFGQQFLHQYKNYFNTGSKDALNSIEKVNHYLRTQNRLKWNETIQLGLFDPLLPSQISKMQAFFLSCLQKSDDQIPLKIQGFRFQEGQKTMSKPSQAYPKSQAEKRLFKFLEFLVTKLQMTHYKSGLNKLKKLHSAKFGQIENTKKDVVLKKPLVKPILFDQFLESDSQHLLDTKNAQAQYEQNEDLDFQKRENKTFDHYLKISSSLLKKQTKNPYLSLDEIFEPEDYLIEALLCYLYKNFPQLKNKMISIEDEEYFDDEEDFTSSDEDSFSDEEENFFLYQEDIENFLSAYFTSSKIQPSFLDTTSLIIEFLKTRKQQRNLFLKNNKSLLKLKNLLAVKKKIQTCLFYNTIFNKDPDEQKMLKNLFQFDTLLSKGFNQKALSKQPKTMSKHPKERRHFFVLRIEQILRQNIPTLFCEQTSRKCEFPSFLKKSGTKVIQNMDLVFLQTSVSGERATYRLYPFPIKSQEIFPLFNFDSVKMETFFKIQKKLEQVDQKSDFFEFYNQKKNQNSNSKSRRINAMKFYYNFNSRLLSGYILPDIARTEFLNLKTLLLNSFSAPLLDVSTSLLDVPIEKDLQTFGCSDIAFKYQQKLKERSRDQFFEFRENFNEYSWSILFFLSSGWVFVNLFKNIYKKYAKEIVESCIDFLNRAGILEDVQWIKEELGMMPVDKGYRGIRHHGKKFKNIIGLDRKHTILQVSEMVWFLKTRKMSTFFDPILRVIISIRPSCHLYELKKFQHLFPSSEKRYIIPAPTFPTFMWPSRYRQKKGGPLTPYDPTSLLILKDEFHLDLSTIHVPEPLLEPNATFSEKDVIPGLVPESEYLKPKGFLFVGPPGTGKTLIVQAIAGETDVPVVTQSGGLLQKQNLGSRGGRGPHPGTLHKLFLRAREIAPCIIFIDEVDGIGARRQLFLPLQMSRHRYDPLELVENLKSTASEFGKNRYSSEKVGQIHVKRKAEFFDDQNPYWDEPELTQTLQITQLPVDVLQELHVSRGLRSAHISMLTQFLIELDGLHPLDNILVVGATNRFEILDPALLRPGRFQRVLKFNLPNYTARIHLFKLYTQASRIGFEKFSWDYFAKRTYGLSSADIASIVFASELIAVQQSTKHSFETLERGIDLITSFPSDPVMLRLVNLFPLLEKKIQKFYFHNSFLRSFYPFDRTPLPLPTKKGWGQKAPLQETSHLLRNCYYNIGKILIFFCLQIMPFHHHKMSLWERPKNFRFLFLTKNFNFNEFVDLKMLPRKEIEKRLFSFFGGKAAESIFIFSPLHQFSYEISFQFDETFLSLTNSLEQSNFGIENEIQTAQNLLILMIEKWYFYLERIATEKFHPIFENSNLWESSERESVLAQALVEEMIIELDMRNTLSKNEQKHSYQTWWMKKVATQLNFREKKVLSWSRLYLSDPENSAQNVEWSAPDEFFHTIDRTPPNCMSWTHFLENGRFAVSNLILLKSFNMVFKTLRQFTEFMDFISDSFLRNESLTEEEFKNKIYQFYSR